MGCIPFPRAKIVDFGELSNNFLEIFYFFYTGVTPTPKAKFFYSLGVLATSLGATSEAEYCLVERDSFILN